MKVTTTHLIIKMALVMVHLAAEEAIGGLLNVVVAPLSAAKRTLVDIEWEHYHKMVHIYMVMMVGLETAKMVPMQVLTKVLVAAALLDNLLHMEINMHPTNHRVVVEDYIYHNLIFLV